MHPTAASPDRLRLGLLVPAAGLALLVAVAILPWLLRPNDPGDAQTRWMIRLALAYYGAAAVLMLRLRPAEWTARPLRGSLARWVWTLAWAAYLVHVGFAFHYFHHWSHQAAYEHTDRATGGHGYGIYVNYLFTLAWTVDVAWWWLAPAAYATRPHRVGTALHAFLAFVVFNASVVFEPGPARWVAALMFAGLAFLFFFRGRTGRPWRRGDDEPLAEGRHSPVSQGW
jgi:hypothetical protein